MGNKNWFYLCLILICLQCHNGAEKKNIERSFYYWKTVYSLNPEEKIILDSLSVKKLYIRYFDVDWDEKNKRPIPKAPISFKEIPTYNVVPVIFITNRTMVNIAEIEIPELAKSIVSKVESLHVNQRLSYGEIQMDCDWSEKSRKNYFKLLQEIKILIGGSLVLSATIRLHQVKFSNRTGVPPVDRGVLMVYNMAAINDLNTVNSIFDAEIVDQYTDNLADYPLHLDLAFPMYLQNVLFRGGQYIGVWRDKNIFDPKLLPSYFKHVEKNTYKCIKDTFMHNMFIRNEDIVRIEETHLSEVKNVLKTIKNQLKSDTFTIIFFDINSSHAKHTSIEEIKSIF